MAEDSPSLETYRKLLSQPVLDKDMVKEFLDSTTMFNDLELLLRGFHQHPELVKVNNPDTGKEEQVINFEYKFGDPLLNERGVKYVMGQIKGSANKIIYLSNLNTIETYELIKIECLNVLKELWINYKNKNFEIRDLTALVNIYSIILAVVISIFKRPFEAGERHFIKDTTQEHTIITSGDQKGFGLMGGGKK